MSSNQQEKSTRTVNVVLKCILLEYWEIKLQSSLCSCVLEQPSKPLEPCLLLVHTGTYPGILLSRLRTSAFFSQCFYAIKVLAFDSPWVNVIQDTPHFLTASFNRHSNAFFILHPSCSFNHLPLKEE